MRAPMATRRKPVRGLSCLEFIIWGDSPSRYRRGASLDLSEERRTRGFQRPERKSPGPPGASARTPEETTLRRGLHQARRRVLGHSEARGIQHLERRPGRRAEGGRGGGIKKRIRGDRRWKRR